MIRLRLVRVPRRPRIRWGPVLAVTLWLALVAAVSAAALAAGKDPRLCLFKRVTGIPGPTCGSTRGALRILAGDPAGALRTNPLLFTAAAVLLALLLLRVGGGRGIRLALSGRGRIAAWVLAGALLAANWAWVIWKVG